MPGRMSREGATRADCVAGFAILTAAHVEGIEYAETRGSVNQTPLVRWTSGSRTDLQTRQPCIRRGDVVGLGIERPT